jgi:acetylxylan esterase
VTARRLAIPATVAAVALIAPAVRAAPSGPVAGYTTANVPGYVSMYEYVPAKPAASPPVLVVAHYCGGNAAGMFGVAAGGGLVAAADKYGFLMLFPQTSNNCWDVGSTKALTHDGGGDTQAIAEMVKYEISHRGANPNRVYATGQSSGAMMTEALLAVYPDVFKAGAEFSGVPAGCWAVNDPGGGWSQPCALGQVTYTPQQWGDLVRAMDPRYSGYRPRIQLWHGTADGTINYNNQLEAIKEWTNVLGLSATPTTASLTINNHDFTRQTWKDSCGSAVLDELSEKSGPHNTDASENATYVIPFLGLDNTGPVDPAAAACPGGAGGSGAAGSGGAGGGAAGSGTGGSEAAGSGAGAGGAAGPSGAGGALGSGDAATNGPGGAAGSTGSARTDAGAPVGSSGSTGMGGGGGAVTGQTASDGSSGCGCALSGARSGRHAEASGALVLAAAFVRRRRQRTLTHD